MSGQTGKWETVVNKKKGHVTKTDVKKAQQKFYDNVTHQQFEEKSKNPLEESKTIFQSFDTDRDAATSERAYGKENEGFDKYPSMLHSSYSSPGKTGAPKPQANTKILQGKKKTTKPAKPDPLLTVVNNIKMLDVDDFNALVAERKEKFPNHPNVWLSDAASWLQAKTIGPVEKDLALRGQDPEFPCNQLPLAVREAFDDLLKSCPENCWSTVMSSCISSMLAEAQQGKSTLGYRIICQLLIRQRPAILKEKLHEPISRKNNTAESYHIIMWIFAQTTDDLAYCMQVWWNIMFPVLKVRSHAPLSVDYLHAVLRKHEETVKNKPYLKCNEFLSLLDAAFSLKSPLAHTQSVKRRFAELYHSMKVFLFTSDPSKYSAIYFKYFLKALNTDESSVKFELLQLLTSCLCNNSATFDTWKGCFRQSLVESSILLSHIERNMASFTQELTSKGRLKKSNILEDTLKEFLSILIDMHHRGEGSKPGFRDCYHICERNVKKIKRKPKTSPSFLFRLLKYMLVSSLVLVTLDVYKHRGWTGSTSEKLSKSSGLEALTIKTFSYLRCVGDSSGRWIAKNVPYYYSEVHPYVEKTMDTTVYYIGIGSDYVYVKSEPVRVFINEHLPVLMEQIDDIVLKSWQYLSTQVCTLWEAAFPYVKEVIEFGKYVLYEGVPKIKDNVVRGWLNFVYTVYNLNPEFFQNVSLTAASCWDKVTEVTPVVIEKIQNLIVLTLSSASGCLQQGQNWIHTNILGHNASPTGASQ